MFRRAACLALAVLVTVPSNAAESDAPPVTLDSDENKTLYALGLAMSRQFRQFEFSEQELAVIQSGLVDGALGREPAVSLQEWGPKINPFLQARMAARGESELAEGQAFLDEMKNEPGAEVLDSGLIVFTEREGEGESPGPTAMVQVNYRGTFRNGEEFDSSEPGNPVSFSLGGVVPCFTEGIRKMKVGGKARLVCPSELAYGPRGNPPRVPPNSVLVFEVELVGFSEPEADPEADPEAEPEAE